MKWRYSMVGATTHKFIQHIKSAYRYIHGRMFTSAKNINSQYFRFDKATRISRIIGARESFNYETSIFILWSYIIWRSLAQFRFNLLLFYCV